MRKSLVLVAFILVFRLLPFAQSPSQELNSLRELALASSTEDAAELNQLLQWNDSLRVSKSKWSVEYDSLLNDTVALSPWCRSVVKLDAALLNYLQMPNAVTFFYVKELYRDLSVEGHKEYMQELTALLREYAVETGDYSMAYTLQNKLQAFQFDTWKEREKGLEGSLDSLKRASDDAESEGRRQLTDLSDTAMTWHLLAMISFLLLIVLIVAFVVSSMRWKKQRIKLSQQASDTSEKEILVGKLENARREIHELNVLIKRKVEAPEVIREVQQVPSPSAIDPGEIAEWNDQVQQVLAKIKSHCEQGKSGMPVATYMSIINDTTRLSTQVSKKSEQWISLLTSK